MKLVSMNCPHCNGPLKVNPAFDWAACNYCGYQFMIDDEVKKVKISEDDYEPIGKAVNEARMETDRKTAEETIEKVKRVRDAYNKRGELQGRGQFLRTRLYEDEKQIAAIQGWMKFWNMFPDPVNLFVIPGAILIMFIILAAVVWYAGGGVFFMGLIFSVVAFFLLKRKRDNQGNEYTRLINEANAIKADIVKNDKELQDLNNDAELSFVPEKYKNPAALDFIYQALLNKRANTLSEAINLFEENVYRTNMQRMQDEQLRVTKQQLEEMQRQKEQEDRSGRDQKGVDAASVISTVGKVAATGLFLKAGHDILKGIKDQFF